MGTHWTAPSGVPIHYSEGGEGGSRGCLQRATWWLGTAPSNSGHGPPKGTILGRLAMIITPQPPSAPWHPSFKVSVPLFVSLQVAGSSGHCEVLWYCCGHPVARDVCPDVVSSLRSIEIRCCESCTHQINCYVGALDSESRLLPVRIRSMACSCAIESRPTRLREFISCGFLCWAQSCHQTTSCSLLISAILRIQGTLRSGGGLAAAGSRRHGGSPGTTPPRASRLTSLKPPAQHPLALLRAIPIGAPPPRSQNAGRGAQRTLTAAAGLT